MLISAPILYAPSLPPPARAALPHVLDVTIFHTPSGGGVRTYLDAKARWMAARGVPHTLVLPAAGDSIEVEGTQRIYRLKSPPVPGTPGYRFLVSPQGLERIIQSERPDIIELGSPFLVPFLVRWATRDGPRPPLVGFYHSDLLRTYALPSVEWMGPRGREMGALAARRYIRAVYGRCDVTVAASPTVARELESMGIPDVRLVPLGVDLALFHPLRRTGELHARLGIEKGVPLGIFCGRFCREKRLDVVLQAQALLPPSVRPHLVLVGKGQLAEALEKLAAGNPHLTVLPFEPDRVRLAGMMADADFYLAPGPGETFGLAIAEAMAAGLPVLGVDSGAVPDRIGGEEAGELYPDGDVAGCVAALRRLLGRLGPELRDGARGRAERHWAWDRTFATLTALYDELLHRRRGGVRPPLPPDDPRPLLGSDAPGPRRGPPPD